MLAPSRAVEIACALLSALGEAHRLGVLHRDVKPANILFDDAGVARLGDFGVAHLGDLSATATAGVIGTLAYMSPEQRGGRPATARSDLYGVGVLLREMLTGEHPVLGEPPRLRPSDVHRELNLRHDALVSRLTEEDPDLRPHDAYEARRALLTLSWPAVVETVENPPRRTARSSVRPPAYRLELEAGRLVNRFLERAIERVPLDELSLKRARAFAQAAHPALQLVLRVDRAQGHIWLEEAKGAPLTRVLTPAERATLREALSALHALGTAHGQVDGRHVLVAPSGQVTLRFEGTQDATSTADLDHIALARL